MTDVKWEPKAICKNCGDSRDEHSGDDSMDCLIRFEAADDISGLRAEAAVSESECSRLASRVEQEHRIGELIRADKEAAENRVLELEKALRIIAAWPFNIMGDCVADAKKLAADVLAGAHAEEKE
jgi:hypothetical protein